MVVNEHIIIPRTLLPFYISMAFPGNLLIRHRFISLINPKTLNSINSNFPIRTITSLPKSANSQTKKPLSTLFSEVMSGKTTTIEEEQDGEGDIELKKKLKQLTEEVRTIKEKKAIPIEEVPKKVEKRSLYSAFTNKPVTDGVTKMEVEKKKKKIEPFVIKELSIDTVMFLKYLYENGYFKDAKFANVNERFDLGWFENRYALGYAKFAAIEFAKDNREIAKWLSGSALKQVAAFGCPSTSRSSVFPAKRLRKFFEVPENTVCSKCMLRDSCKFVNQNVWKCDANNLNVEIFMNVIISYALHWVHPQLVVSDEVNKSVDHLLNEFVKLSQIT
ncbi:uncharacterized protein LOC123894908 [Trifolium pratense]|uniref:uncharacterized protein LOC123894908 n=1 Tax=Trifolium pratense TaxID=57577 RepID=UPI001E698318|nr:uncharacterized protein LOC123894908 [Trifolium pratense]XP_045800979.1 uncharacterized protein LOC123894908 [Trifolium pratense]